jgi:hypothetical protein
MWVRRGAVGVGLAGVLGVAGCTVSTVGQRGTVMAPRAPLYDGDPIGRGVQAGARIGMADGNGKADRMNDATAVAWQEGGVSLFWAVTRSLELGLVGDAAWAPNHRYLGGDASDGVPAGPSVAAATAIRQSFPLGRMRLGYAAELGLTSNVLEVAGARERDTSLLLRGALIVTFALRPVVLYGTAGAATENAVPAVVDAAYPGARTALAATLGLGGSLRVGDGGRLGLRLGHGGGTYGAYPRIDLSFAWTFGAPATAPASAATVPPSPRR